MGDRSALTLQDIWDILDSCAGIGLPGNFDADTPLVIDSLAAVWIQHLLAERHGVEVEAADVIGAGRTVSSLHAMLSGSTDA
jgi:hypothetical protein